MHWVIGGTGWDLVSRAPDARGSLHGQLPLPAITKAHPLISTPHSNGTLSPTSYHQTLPWSVLSTVLLPNPIQ
jgi:hypothetical protein